MNKNLQNTWMECLRFMRDNLDSIEEKEDSGKLDDSFDLLFSKVRPVSLENKNLTLEVPSDFYKEYIEDNYLSLLSTALKKNIGKGVKLWYSVMENKPKNKRTKPITKHVMGQSVPTPRVQTLEQPRSEKQVANPFVASRVRQTGLDSQLNPSLSFDNFIVGESNEFAATVGKTIAKRPGTTSFNPLFMHGRVGVGKTHLAQAIGLEVKNQHPEKVVLYVSSEKFIQQFISAAKAQNKTSFANFYQMVDCLIIDDIQFLSGKAATQDMFFHIFDHLHQRGKQIILTADKAPVDIQDIQERIVSRFKWGLSAEIKPPDYITRRKIIVNKLHRDGITLDEELVDHLAAEVDTNVRDLVGIINSVVAYSMVLKREMTLDLLKETISKIAASREKTINIEYIQQVVCDYFGIEKTKLLSKTRKREIAMPRQLAMYFAKKYTNATFAKIGEEMGGKDHSTVMYACDTIRDQSKVDKEMKKYVKELKERILQ